MANKADEKNIAIIGVARQARDQLRIEAAHRRVTLKRLLADCAERLRREREGEECGNEADVKGME